MSLNYSPLTKNHYKIITQMSYIYYNPNPKRRRGSDCVIRMLCKICGFDWESAYLALSSISLSEYDMPSSNDIWEIYLKSLGFKKSLLPTNCPNCMNVREFSDYFNRGTYVACTGTHVVAVINGNYYDAWDSGDEVVSFFFERR